MMSSANLLKQGMDFKTFKSSLQNLFTSADQLNSPFWLLFLAAILPFLASCSAAKFDEKSSQSTPAPVVKPVAPAQTVQPQAQTNPQQVNPQINPQVNPQQAGQQPAVSKPVGRIEAPPVQADTGDKKGDKKVDTKTQTATPAQADDAATTVKPVGGATHKGKKAGSRAPAPVQQVQKPTVPQNIIVININNNIGTCGQACGRQSVQMPAPIVREENCQKGNCWKAELEQKKQYSVSKMDILFVVDSNSTLVEARQKMSAQLQKFMLNLPPLDYRVAFLSRTAGSGGAQVSDSFRSASENSVLSMNLSTQAQANQSNAGAVIKEMSSLMQSSGDLVTSSTQLLSKLNESISEPMLSRNQKDELGKSSFFRPDAGLIIVALSDERASAQTLRVEEARSMAHDIYEKIMKLKTLGQSQNLVQSLPVEMVVFSALSSNQEMSANSNRTFAVGSPMMELAHLLGGRVYDLRSAMSKDALFTDAAEQIRERVWMKLKFKINPLEKSVGSKYVCVLANNQLVPTKFVSETSEIRVQAPVMSSILKSNPKAHLTVHWCEDGSNEDAGRSSNYEVNQHCLEKYSVAK